MQKKVFDIYDGFRIVRKTEYMSVEKAVSELSSRKQRYYAFAVLSGNTAALYSESLVCPCCGHRIPAYKQFILPSEKYKKTPKDKIRSWADEQICIDDFSTSRVICLADFPEKNKKYIITCHHCCYVGEICSAPKKVFVASDRYRCTVGVRLHADSLIKYPFVAKQGLCIKGAVTETVTFNMKNGHTFIKLKTEEKTLFCRDITEFCMTDNYEDAVLKILDVSPSVRRKVLRFIQKFWKIPLPFSPLNLNTELFILLVRFQNYSRSFYENLPREEKNHTLEVKSRRIIKQMKTAGNIPEMVERLNLPDVKSIRRILYTQPYLLFFDRELEKIYAVLQDVNLFCSVLKHPFCSNILSSCRNLQIFVGFMQMYSEKRGGKELAELLCREPDLQKYAVNFMALRPSLQKKEMKNWKLKYMKKVLYDYNPDFMGPCFINPIFKNETVRKTIPPYYINGYSFKKIQTTNEYKTAASELYNCLENYIGDAHLIVGVSYAGKYVAAVELDDNIITQHLGINNISLEEDPELYAAYLKWMKHFRLKQTGNYGEIL